MIPDRPTLRLLHLEDNKREAELIHAIIRDEWPGCDIRRVDTRVDFLTQLARDRFDLILSDFTLPAFNGLDALELARRQDASIPFIVLSGTIGEDNAVLALQRGAVDYVIKDRPARLIPAMQRALALRREQQLRQEAEHRLREQAGLLDKARDAICVTDLDGRVTYWNQSAEKLLGWAGAVGRSHLLELLFRHSVPGRREEALRLLHAVGSWSGEIRLTGRDGGLVHVESRWTMVHDDDGRPKSILLINTDVTEQKRLESQLLRSQRMESIGTLAGGVAHDLNNALSPILMSVSLLRASLQDDNLLRITEVLEKSAQHGSALIRQLLAFARGAEGEHRETQPQMIIKDAVTLLGDTLPRSIAIETNLARELWPVRANSTQLIQMLMNLGINARDAMPKGGRLVFGAENVLLDECTARANPGIAAGPHVRITVADNGSGIPPELINHIFDPFFTTKAAGKGTGLGLASVASIIKGHGGMLQVQSEVGHGTEFRLYLPAVPATKPAASPPAIPAPPRGHGQTILVIDDNEGVRDIMHAVLVAYGFNVRLAADGHEGLMLYRQHRDSVKVVVTDMMMPGLQGHEVIRELRRLNPDVRIVAMSGIASELAALPPMPGRLVLLSKPMNGPDTIRAIHAVMHEETRPSDRA